MSREFTCGRCGETFEKTWTDEEAKHEKTAIFGAIPLAACVVVCDDCWRKDWRVRRAFDGNPP